MNTPTFKEQFDKITEAYFRNEVKPYDNCGYFIGNLLNGTNAWSYMRMLLDEKIGMEPKRECRNSLDPELGFYTMYEICQIETVFMRRIWKDYTNVSEQTLFEAMELALDELCKVHEAKGEQIESFEFNKRVLETT